MCEERTRSRPGSLFARCERAAWLFRVVCRPIAAQRFPNDCPHLGGAGRVGPGLWERPRRCARKRRQWAERPENDPASRFQRGRASFSSPPYKLPPAGTRRGCGVGGPRIRVQTAACLRASEGEASDVGPGRRAPPRCPPGCGLRPPRRDARPGVLCMPLVFVFLLVVLGLLYQGVHFF